MLLPLRKCLAVSCVNNPLDFVDGLPTMTTVSKKKWVLEPGCGTCRGFKGSLSGKQSVAVLSDYCIRRRPKKEAVSAWCGAARSCVLYKPFVSTSGAPLAPDGGPLQLSSSAGIAIAAASFAPPPRRRQGRLPVASGRGLLPWRLSAGAAMDRLSQNTSNWVRLDPSPVKSRHYLRPDPWPLAHRRVLGLSL